MTKITMGKKKHLYSIAMLLIICMMLAGCSNVEKKDGAEPTPTEAGADSQKPGGEGQGSDETPSPTPTEEVKAPLYEVEPVESVLGTRLCEHYQDMFRVGTCVNGMTVSNPNINKLILEQFNSLTCENEMKPDALLNQAACRSTGEVVIAFSQRTTKILDFARDHKIPVRGHTLVWHAQTPDWFFREGFQSGADFVSADEMKIRMESYIRQVIEYCEKYYPGVVYAWDVVNEAFQDGNGQIRECNWTKVLGEDYIRLAFEYARKYAPEGVKLFYNDFNCYMSDKQMGITKKVKELKELGLIDGIGMQSHLKTGYPNINDYLRTVEKFSQLGVELHLTELDVGCDAGDKGLESQKNYYQLLFSMLSAYEKQGISNITSVTFWGVTDNTSWRRDERPLLFDNFGDPKDAYYSVLQENK